MFSRGTGPIVNVIGTGSNIASPIHIPGGAASAALMLASTGLFAGLPGLRRKGCCART